MIQGQKGVDFLYNPYIRYEYDRGAFLIGIIASIKSLSALFGNTICIRIFNYVKMKTETILLTGCGMLIVAYSTIGLSGASEKVGSPNILFYIGVAISGIAAFLSPILRSLMTATVNTSSNTSDTIRAVTLLGSIAAIESFCDFLVPFVYGFGLWEFLLSIKKVPLIFCLGAFFYFLAGVAVAVCRKDQMRNIKKHGSGTDDIRDNGNNNLGDNGGDNGGDNDIVLQQALTGLT